MDTLSTKANPRTLKRLWWAIFWVSFPFGMLSFALPIYGRELGASALEIGGLFAALSFLCVIVRPFLGRMLDRWGRRWFLLLGLFGYSIAMVAYSFADTVWLLTIAGLVQGLGQAFLWVSAYTIIADATGQGRDFGMIDEAVNRGAIIGTTTGFAVVFILQGYSGMDWQQIWKWLFLAYAISTFLGFWIAWRGVPETLPKVTDKSIESRPLSSQLFALMSIVFITGASSAMVWPILVVFLQDVLNAQMRDIALAYLPAALLSSFLPSRMGRIADLLGRKGPMIAGLLIGAVASVFIPHLRSLIPLAALWAIESLGYTASMPAERAFVADIAGQDMRGTSYGLYTFAYFLGATLGPLLGGWLYDRVLPGIPFYLNTGVLVLGALLVGLLLREPNSRKTDKSTSEQKSDI